MGVLKAKLMCKRDGPGYRLQNACVIFKIGILSVWRYKQEYKKIENRFVFIREKSFLPLYNRSTHS